MFSQFEFALSSVAPRVEFVEDRWYALYTCSRHEKRVADQLQERSIESFLPTYRTARRWADRTKVVTLPLFSGYLFVRIPWTERLRVLQLPGAVRLVGFNGSPTPLPDAEIEALRNALRNEVHVVPHPYLRIGNRVRVHSGPLQGAEGILMRKKGATRLVLSLDLLMRSVSVEVCASDVCPVQ
jgi:transcription antitermination factor NusG